MQSRSKAELRREFSAIVDSLDPLRRAPAAATLAEHVLDLPEVRKAGGILTCLSFGGEIDTWSLADRLIEEGKRVYVPRAEQTRPHLTVHRYPCPLETLSFGLRQPADDSTRVEPETLDRTVEVALLLGLAFDRGGVRLGYGKGYFDRFLEGRRFPAVGIAFDAQVVAELPSEPHDVPMAAIVSELGVIRPPKPPRPAHDTHP